MQVKKDLGLHGTRGHEHKRKENPGSIDFASKDTLKVFICLTLLGIWLQIYFLLSVMF